MQFMDISPFLLLRIKLGRNSFFPHGRIVPYAGIGIAYLQLNGPLGPRDLHFRGVGFVGKFGLEWIISRNWKWFGGLAASVEGRYVMGVLKDAEDNSHTEYWWGWLPVTSPGGMEAMASLSYWQLTAGIALHLGTR
jgi:hypothetical protein